MLRSLFPFLFLLASCGPKPAPGPRCSDCDGETVADTAALVDSGEVLRATGDAPECGPVAAFSTGSVSCSDPALAWESVEGIEVYAGAIVFVVGTQSYAVTGSCLVEGS
jgi:hypothetical protein